MSYLLPAQLAFSQLPGSLVPAVVGWSVGYAWRMGLLPVLGGREWRVPGWVVGEKVERGGTSVEGGGGAAEGLRRRMQEQGIDGAAGGGSGR